MVDQDVLLADRREDARPAREWRGHLGLEAGLLEVTKAFELGQAGEHGEVDGAGHLVDVAVVQVERGSGLKLGEEAFLGLVRDFETHGRAPFPEPEGLLDRGKEAPLDLGLLDRADRCCA